jgi:hypothetical protein
MFSDGGSEGGVLGMQSQKARNHEDAKCRHLSRLALP